jgi:deoxyribodipyrimidine photo-lyase
MSPPPNSAGPARQARPAIVWFRDELRLTGQPALAAAAADGPVLPVFVVEDEPRRRAPGAAARWWQRGSVEALSEAIQRLGGRLHVCSGKPERVLSKLAADTDAAGVFCQRTYDASGRAQEAAVAAQLPSHTRFESLRGDLLAEPEDMLTKAGEPYRVFTPFWRALLERLPDEPVPSAELRSINWANPRSGTDVREALVVPDERAGWTAGLERTWTPGEAAARDALSAFIDDGLATYDEDRNLPAVRGTSRLSPHLRFGEIGIRELWDAVDELRADSAIAPNQCTAWLRELGWREFCRHLLFHFPEMQTHNYRSEFDAFAWREDASGLRAWQRGRTGYPLVDAGMRELWATGWMHNRVRMVVASFLTKHLRVHWCHGEAWFWDTLVDADYANNPANWQWTAGTGVDAAPYFRVFNPTTQAQKFDAEGAYIRRFVPELADLPTKALHAPWLAPASNLAKAGVVLGDTYALPLVDHAQARAAALAAHAALRKPGG